MRIRSLSAALLLAGALAAGTASAAPAAAPAKFKDVLAPFKGKEVTIANSGKAEDARPRKLVLVGDDYLAVEQADGRRSYFLFVRVASLQIADGAATIYLKD